MNTHEHGTSPCTIDAHAHLVPAQLLRDLTSGRVNFPNVSVPAHEQTFRVAFNGGTPTRPIAAGLTDQAKRRNWLADNGIDLQIVGGWLDLFGYELPDEEGADWAALMTDSITSTIEDNDRQVALGTVPLQSPERAAEAVRKQRADGLPGVMIATRAGRRELSDPQLAPFWEAANESGAVIFLHPGFGGASPRYQDFGLINGLARLEDTTITLARLLYAGIPAKYPRVRIVSAHAGAALPYVLGRLTRNHLMNPDTTSDPLESFANLYFDSVVFDPDALNFLIQKVGADHVLLGSDYPFPIGDLTPLAILDEAGLSAHDRELIGGSNARHLFLGEPRS